MTDPTLAARPTVYNGIKMRSRLEAGYAAWLDEHNFDWEYEPQCFATKDGQYLPDFLLRNVTVTHHNDVCDVYVEVKPRPFVEQEGCEDRYENLSNQFDIIAASNPTAIFLLAVNGPDLEDRPELRWVSELLTTLEMRYAKSIGHRWPHFVAWVRVPNDRLGLAFPVPADQGPWPDGYWKPKV